MGDLRSLLPAEVAIASGLWAPQTRSWLGLSYDEHRPGSHRQTEHRVLARPLGRSIAQTRDADPARQSPLDGSMHEFGREEGERDCHIDLSNAAFLARRNLLVTDDGAGNDLIKPAPAARNRCDERRPGLGAHRSGIVWRGGRRHGEFASPLHWRLFPRNAHYGSRACRPAAGDLAVGDDPRSAQKSVP